jgi:hypothetical protein
MTAFEVRYQREPFRRLSMNSDKKVKPTPTKTPTKPTPGKIETPEKVTTKQSG